MAQEEREALAPSLHRHRPSSIMIVHETTASVERQDTTVS